jgi:hypothetical protein
LTPNGQSLAYVYSRENANDAHMAKVLTEDEARRIASNIAKHEKEYREVSEDGQGRRTRSDRSPTTSHDCKVAGMKWNDQSNVCG